MNIRRLGVWVAGGALVACNGASGSSGASGGSTGSTASSAATSSGARSTSHASASSSSKSAGGDGGTTAATLSATLRNQGRHGDTLQIAISGNDPNAQTTEAQVQLVDAAGNGVVAFDTDWDGVADSAQQLLHFDQSTLGQKAFTATITLPTLYPAGSPIASAVIALSDVNGALSAPATAALQAQAVVAQGAACDPAFVANRCDEGLSCSGKPATCTAGVAPTLSQVAYYGGASPLEVFLGSDPDMDLTKITVSFLDANGNSTKVDLGDGTQVSGMTIDARGATDASFGYTNAPAPSFALTVPKISATPIDAAGHTGAAVVASLGAQPLHTSGQACDAYGVAGCGGGYACSPGLVGATNTCGPTGTLQTAKCAAAQSAAAGGARLAAWGAVQGVSLWDPPSGCAFASEVARPEALVTLKLAKAVTTLTLSTANPETDFDTVLYVLPSCATTSAQALGCNDDAKGFASELTLTNVAAGTYVVVIDSGSPGGGHFGLSVTAQ